jgi:dihydropteroate synthase
MFTLNCKGRLLEIESPIVMGIINVTPDSFYEGSRNTSVDAALKLAEQMMAEGATILDIGGQSTRPGSRQLSVQQEMDRVLPVIEKLSKQTPHSIISIDTFDSEIAKAAVAAGASIVNDISGGLLDDQMLSTIASLNVPYICMHTKGSPQTMQKMADYKNVVNEVMEYFVERTTACKNAGIKDVIIDPGFGFAKTIQHNFQLLRSLEGFSIFNKPVLLGVSRKSTIYKTLNTTADEALNGTTVLHTIGLQKGASILRVHDVKPAMECIRLLNAMNAS